MRGQCFVFLDRLIGVLRVAVKPPDKAVARARRRGEQGNGIPVDRDRGIVLAVLSVKSHGITVDRHFGVQFGICVNGGAVIRLRICFVVVPTGKRIALFDRLVG